MRFYEKWFVMEICKNKKTGRVFIYLDEIDSGHALMITPLGDVKELEHDLFTNPIEVDDEEMLLIQGRINNRQYHIYNQYNQN
jgi:hypothetical protein